MMNKKILLYLCLFTCTYGFSQLKFETNLGLSVNPNIAKGKQENTTIFNNEVYFTAEDHSSGKQYVYRFDGENYFKIQTFSSGTNTNYDFITDNPSFKVRNINGTDELMLTGSLLASGTNQFDNYIISLEGGLNVGNEIVESSTLKASEGTLEVINNEVFFTSHIRAQIGKVDVNNQLSSGIFAMSEIGEKIVFNSTFFISSRAAGSNDVGVELYLANPNDNLPTLVQDINTTTAIASSFPADFLEANGKLYFTADSGTGRELYVYNPNNISKVSKIDILANNAEDPMHLTYYESGTNKYILFSANTGASNGRELVRVNTANDNATLLSINPGAAASNPEGFTIYNGLAYFSAEGISGIELYRTNGASTGTTLVSDINTSGNSNPNTFLEYKNDLYFQAETSKGIQLYKVDNQNTVTLIEAFSIFNTNKSIDPKPLFVYKDRLFFSGETVFQSGLFSYKKPTVFTGAVDDKWETVGNWTNGLPNANDDAIIIEAPVTLSSNVKCSFLDTSHPSALITMSPNTNNTSPVSLVVNGNWNSESDDRKSIQISNLINTNQIANHFPSFLVNGRFIGQGTMGVERYQKENKWHLISSPLNGVKINSYSNDLASGTDIGNANNSIAMSIHNTLTSSWDYYTTNNINTTSAAFVLGKGYRTRTTSTPGLTKYDGSFLNSDIPFSMNNNQGKKWNLVGNPFTSAISSNNNTNTSVNFLTENANELDENFVAMYFYDPNANAGEGGYTVINNSSDPHYVPVGQGFFLKGKQNANSVLFRKEMQSNQTEDIFLKSSVALKPKLTLMITDGTNFRSTDLKYITGATTGLDIGFDAGLFDGDNENNVDIEIYSRLVNNFNNRDFMLQCLPQDYENIVVPIGIKSSPNVEVTLTLNATNLPTGLKVFLEDTTTNTFTRLDQPGDEAKFTQTISGGANRFRIHTTSQPLSVENQLNNNVSVFVNNNVLYIKGLSENTNIKIYNLLGKEVLSANLNLTLSKEFSISKSLKSGIYIVKLETKEGVLTKKIFLE